jgi:DNA-binding NarL/FixJ family response regulator
LGERQVKRLAVVAEDSLIVEAIGIALRRSGEFNVVAHIDARSASAQEIVEVSPEVVLIDEMENSERPIALIREVKAASDGITVIVLTLSPETARLDEMFEAGASAAVSKATQPGALAALIRETLEGRVLHIYKPVGQVTGAPAKPALGEDSVLSGRELEVLRLVAAGSTNSEIARKLWVTEQTVKFHLSNIYRKLDVANRTEASHYAHVHGLLSGGESAVAS